MFSPPPEKNGLIWLDRLEMRFAVGQIETSCMCDSAQSSNLAALLREPFRSRYRQEEMAELELLARHGFHVDGDTDAAAWARAYDGDPGGVWLRMSADRFVVASK
jgi:hypothetical protein